MSEVLVVEDDPVTGRIITAALRQAGHAPLLFTTGAAALDGLEQHDPEVVCLHRMLPDASGRKRAGAPP